MALAGSEGGTQSHSAVALGVSADGQYVFTVEGNVWRNPDGSGPHCVKFNRRNLLNSDGNFDTSQFGAVGKINKFF